LEVKLDVKLLLTAMQKMFRAFNEVFKQPVIDTWGSSILCSETCTYTFDFEKDPVERLHLIEVPFELKATRPCLMHGIASWFDVKFDGSQ
jgi:hypothetical protein